MSASRRRESILEAATRAFARTGYAGTSTATIAAEANVSQPYVIQMFGSKGQLFRSVYERADLEVLRSLHAALRESSSLGLDSSTQMRRAAWACIDRLPDRALVQVVMHGFLAGTTCPEVTGLAQHSMARLHRTVQELTGCSDEQSGYVVGHLILAGALQSLHGQADPQNTTLEVLADTVFGNTFLGRVRVEAS